MSELSHAVAPRVDQEPGNGTDPLWAEQLAVPNAVPGRESPAADIVEVWGLGSFPASDPPANW